MRIAGGSEGGAESTERRLEDGVYYFFLIWRDEQSPTDGGRRKASRCGGRCELRQGMVMPKMWVREKHLVWGIGLLKVRHGRHADISPHAQQGSWYPRLPTQALVKLRMDP